MLQCFCFCQKDVGGRVTKKCRDRCTEQEKKNKERRLGWGWGLAVFGVLGRGGGKTKGRTGMKRRMEKRRPGEDIREAERGRPAGALEGKVGMRSQENEGRGEHRELVYIRYTRKSPKENKWEHMGARRKIWKLGKEEGKEREAKERDDANLSRDLIHQAVKKLRDACFSRA